MNSLSPPSLPTSTIPIANSKSMQKENPFAKELVSLLVEQKVLNEKAFDFLDQYPDAMESFLQIKAFHFICANSKEQNSKGILFELLPSNEICFKTKEKFIVFGYEPIKAFIQMANCWKLLPDDVKESLKRMAKDFAIPFSETLNKNDEQKLANSELQFKLKELIEQEPNCPFLKEVLLSLPFSEEIAKWIGQEFRKWEEEPLIVDSFKAIVRHKAMVAINISAELFSKYFKEFSSVDCKKLKLKHMLKSIDKLISDKKIDSRNFSQEVHTWLIQSSLREHRLALNFALFAAESSPWSTWYQILRKDDENLASDYFERCKRIWQNDSGKFSSIAQGFVFKELEKGQISCLKILSSSHVDSKNLMKSLDSLVLTLEKFPMKQEKIKKNLLEFLLDQKFEEFSKGEPKFASVFIQHLVEVCDETILDSEWLNTHFQNRGTDLRSTLFALYLSKKLKNLPKAIRSYLINPDVLSVLLKNGLHKIAVLLWREMERRELKGKEMPEVRDLFLKTEGENYSNAELVDCLLSASHSIVTVEQFSLLINKLRPLEKKPEIEAHIKEIFVECLRLFFSVIFNRKEFTNEVAELLEQFDRIRQEKGIVFTAKELKRIKIPIVNLDIVTKLCSKSSNLNVHFILLDTWLALGELNKAKKEIAFLSKITLTDEQQKRFDTAKANIIDIEVFKKT